MISFPGVPVSPAKASQTARERARAELTREIKEEARRQLAAVGADALSLRAVSRSLGMVSSALYRYFPSRDDLLTALIIDAYNAIADTVDAASAATPAGSASASATSTPAGSLARWTAVCRAVRSWAHANPHEYALIYGSPVPGYRAPEATIAPASRVPLAFLRIVRDAAATGRLAPRDGAPPLEGPLAAQAAALAIALAELGVPQLPPDVLVRAVIAWTQLFGMVSFELFGQFVGSFDPAGALFEHAVTAMATFVGLH